METIGKYIIEKKIGQGGMGIVYKCLDPEQKRSAAIKVLPQQFAADPAFLQRFKREVMTLQRLDHPSIVKIFDQGETDGSYYYAMEFIEGVSLDGLLDDRDKLPPMEAITIIRGCAQALQYSHSQGIIHRDIKPANIMVLKDQAIKLMDFGIAKVTDATRMTATQGVLGTVEYMSPEQSQGRHVDGRSDLYSLGVVFYQCLTGRLPITGSTPTEVIMKLRTHQVDPPRSWEPNLPRSVDDLIMRLLAKEPEKRVESAQELLRELDRVEYQIKSGITGQRPAVGEQPILSSSEDPCPPFWRNPWFILCLVIFFVLVGWLLFGRQPAAPPGATATTTATAAPSRYGEKVPQEVTLLRWITTARKEKRYDYARDMCAILITYFPETPEGNLALGEKEFIAKVQSGQITDPSADPEAARAERDERLPEVTLLRWTMNARGQKKYDYARALARFIIKYFPNKSQAALAVDELQNIEQSEADDAKRLKEAAAAATTTTTTSAPAPR